MDNIDAGINNLLSDLAPLIKVFLALFIGIIIGWEREYRENIAGMRILALVAVGAALFAGFGGIEGKKFINASVAGGVVTGVGFLGAGVIMRERGALTGLVTAATIWVTAALGMAIALGFFFNVAVITGVVLLILWVFPHLSHETNQVFLYELSAPYDEDRYKQFRRRFEESNLGILRHTRSRKEDQMTCVWHTTGLPHTHKQLSRLFIGDLEVTEFKTQLS